MRTQSNNYYKESVEMLIEEKKNVMHIVDPVTKEVINANPEKHYLVLITWADNTAATEWRLMTGKRDVIDFFFANLQDLELDDCYVISESALIRQAWSPFTFIRFCQEQDVLDEKMESEFDFTFEDFVSFIKDNYDITDEELDEKYNKELNLK